MVIAVLGHEVYGEHYFKYKYDYKGKRTAIQSLYTSVLKWADRLSDESLLNGEGKRALDIGCAYGFVVEVLDRFGYVVVGIDVSEYAVSSGREVVDEEIFLAEASHLPFKVASFNLVTCFEVLEHLASPLSALIDVYNCLLPGGVFVATTPTTSLGAKLIGALTGEKSSTPPRSNIQMSGLRRYTNFNLLKSVQKPFSCCPFLPL